MTMWNIDHPERWQAEQESLTLRGIYFEVDEKEKAQGILRLFLKVDEKSNVGDIDPKFLPLNLTVTYPPSFPYFRPEVEAHEINLPRHQNLLAKNLCLLPRPTSYWLPQTTIGEFLNEQLPKVLHEGEIIDPSVLKTKDGEQAEPISEYYSGYQDFVMDTSSFDIMPYSPGKIACIGSVSIAISKEIKGVPPIWAVENFDIRKQSLGKLPEAVQTMLPKRAFIDIIRLPQPPPFSDPVKANEWLLALLKKENIKPPKLISISLKEGITIETIIGLTFPEEHKPGEIGWGWLFIKVCATKNLVAKNGKKQIVIRKRTSYSRLNRINQDELSFRISTMKPLSTKKIVVFGLGALGGPAAIEFAKNGVSELTIVDFDTVNAGTIVRWPLGAASIGLLKTDALKYFLLHNYPYTKVRPFNYKVGGMEATANQHLEEILQDASMIFDATAETGVSHFLSQEAQKRNIPFVSVYGTPGVWGGAVMRYVPGITEGCWMCFQHALHNGLIPSPPTNRDGTIQALGCGDISFTGASFELDNIVSAGVRLAVSTLCAPEQEYPDLNSDIGILALVNENGHPIFPRWSAHPLSKHPDCPYCHINTHEL